MWAQWIVAAAAVYSFVGVAFALAFVSKSVGLIDPAAKHSSWTFRAMILGKAQAASFIDFHKEQVYGA